MQAINANLNSLIETSPLMINTDRIAEVTYRETGEGIVEITDRKLWSLGVCQKILLQTNVFCSDFLNAFVYSPTENSYPPGEQRESVASQRELYKRLLTEVLNPFLVKWETVFFRRNRKPRCWVRRGKRWDLMSDFIIIQNTAADMCREVKELQQKMLPPEQKPQGTAKRDNGIA